MMTNRSVHDNAAELAYWEWLESLPWVPDGYNHQSFMAGWNAHAAQQEQYSPRLQYLIDFMQLEGGYFTFPDGLTLWQSGKHAR